MAEKMMLLITHLGPKEDGEIPKEVKGRTQVSQSYSQRQKYPSENGTKNENQREEEALEYSTQSVLFRNSL